MSAATRSGLGPAPCWVPAAFSAAGSGDPVTATGTYTLVHGVVAKRLLDDGRDELEVPARRNLRDNAAVARV